MDYCGMLHCGDLIGKMEGANCYCGEVCRGRGGRSSGADTVAGLTVVIDT